MQRRQLLIILAEQCHEQEVEPHALHDACHRAVRAQQSRLDTQGMRAAHLSALATLPGRAWRAAQSAQRHQRRCADPKASPALTLLRPPQAQRPSLGTQGPGTGVLQQASWPGNPSGAPQPYSAPLRPPPRGPPCALPPAAALPDMLRVGAKFGMLGGLAAAIPVSP